MNLQTTILGAALLPSTAPAANDASLDTGGRAPVDHVAASVEADLSEPVELWTARPRAAGRRSQRPARAAAK